MKIVTLLAWLLLSAFGVLVFVFGGYDDSPGAQGLGVLLLSIGLYMLYKRYRTGGVANDDIE